MAILYNITFQCYILSNAREGLGWSVLGNLKKDEYTITSGKVSAAILGGCIPIPIVFD